MQNVFAGIKNKTKKPIIFNVLIERDLNTGLIGMAAADSSGDRHRRNHKKNN